MLKQIIRIILVTLPLACAGIPARSQAPAVYYQHPVTDTLQPSSVWSPPPGSGAQVLLLRNVSEYNASFPVNYAAYAGADSISEGILPDGSGAPVFFPLLNRGALSVVNLSLPPAALLEARLVNVSSQSAPQLPPNTAGLLPAFEAMIAPVSKPRGQLVLSAPLETTVLVVIINSVAYTCYLNNPAPETPYSTQGNTLRLPVNNAQGSVVAVVNAAPSATASATVLLMNF